MRFAYSNATSAFLPPRSIGWEDGKFLVDAGDQGLVAGAGTGPELGEPAPLRRVGDGLGHFFRISFLVKKPLGKNFSPTMLQILLMSFKSLVSCSSIATNRTFSDGELKSP